MDDRDAPITPHLVKLADTALARQAGSPAATSLGKLGEEAAETLRLFLAPLRAGKWLSQKLDDWLEDTRTEVPPGFQVEPEPRIATAFLEALRNEPLDSPLIDSYREMFMSLIDSRRQERLHPAFPKMMAEMSRADALILRAIPTEGRYQQDPESAIEQPMPELIHAWEDQTTDVVPWHGVWLHRIVSFEETSHRNWPNLGMFQLEQPVNDNRVPDNNLQRLGLVKSTTQRDFDEPGVEWFRHLDHILTGLQHPHSTDRPGRKVAFRVIELTDFGRDFVVTCVPAEEVERKWIPWKPRYENGVT